jgi:tight adherence protein B
VDLAASGIDPMIPTIPINPAPFMIAAGAAFTAVFAVLGMAALLNAPRARVMQRVTDREQRTPYAEADVRLLRDRTTSGIRALEVLLRGRTWAKETSVLLDRAGLPLRVGEYLSLRAISVVGTMVLAQTFLPGLGIPRALALIAGFAIGFVVPPLYVNRRINSRRAQMEGQLVELCDLMGSMLRSGFGASQAIATTAEQLGAPLGLELRRVTDAVRLGVDVDEAFEAMNERVDAPDFTVLTTAFGIQRRTGGNLAEILDGVADTIRDRQSLRQEIKTLTAMEQSTATFAAVFPMVLTAGMLYMAPDTFGVLLTETIGRMILGGALLLDLVGFFVMRRVTKLEV